MPPGIRVTPSQMSALAATVRELGQSLADVERVAGDAGAASGHDALGFALRTFDDSWDHNRAVLATDLGLGADALDDIAAAFREHDELLAELLGEPGDDDGGG